MTNSARDQRKATLDAVFGHLAQAPEETDPVAAARAHVETYAMGEQGQGARMCQTVECMAGERRAVWFVPPQARKDARLLHVHGGGWVAGSIESHAALAAEVAWRAAAPVLLIDYRLAPEHPFPAGLDDVIAAIAYIGSHGPEGPAGPARIGVSGDSAGGNLAVVAALACASKGLRGPDRLALMSPFLALSIDNGMFLAPPRDPVVQAQGIAHVAALYAPDGEVDMSWIEPLDAPDTLLSQLCPCLIQASAAESLRGQALAFSQRLWSLGVEARLSLWSEMPHVWHVFLESLRDARAATSEAGSFLTQFD